VCRQDAACPSSERVDKDEKSQQERDREKADQNSAQQNNNNTKLLKTE